VPVTLVFPVGVTPEWNTDVKVPETTVYMFSPQSKTSPTTLSSKCSAGAAAAGAAKASEPPTTAAAAAAAATRARPQTDQIMVSPS
jgi:hypothetical protein